MDKNHIKENSCIPETFVSFYERWIIYLRREWGLAPLCGAAATFSGYSKDPSRLMKASFPRSLSPSLFTCSHKPVSQLENGFQPKIIRILRLQNAG